jgi:hypothetical protein
LRLSAELPRFASAPSAASERLKEMPKEKPSGNNEYAKVDAWDEARHPDQPKTLSELGISYDQSSQ